MPYSISSSNSELVKLVPLSVTMVSGRPKVAKVCLNLSMVTADVAEAVMCTSIHFKYTSIAPMAFCHHNVQGSWVQSIVPLLCQKPPVVPFTTAMVGCCLVTYKEEQAQLLGSAKLGIIV